MSKIGKQQISKSLLQAISSGGGVGGGSATISMGTDAPLLQTDGAVWIDTTERNAKVKPLSSTVVVANAQVSDDEPKTSNTAGSLWFDLD